MLFHEIINFVYYVSLEILKQRKVNYKQLKNTRYILFMNKRLYYVILHINNVLTECGMLLKILSENIVTDSKCMVTSKDQDSTSHMRF